MARSSISAAMASKLRPALASSVCRARLCEASINGFDPRHGVIGKSSFGQPLPLAVGVEFQDRGGGFLDRSPRHVELRPIEFRAEPTRIRDFISHRLAIYIVFAAVARTRPHAQQPVLA